MSSLNELPKDINFLCEWTHDFDKLLSDSFALKLFAQFLKKEYSYENLKFWLSCKKFKKITDRQKRIEYAKHIYDKYLRPGAEQAVNVDNRALIAVKSQLEESKSNIFSIPEKQIYELMKTDCYKRFLKCFYSNNMSESIFHEKIFEKLNKSQSNDTENQLISEKYRKNAYKKLKRLEMNEINRRIAIRKVLRNMSPKKRQINKQSNDEKQQTILSTPECHPIKCERMQRSTQMQSIQWIQSNMSASKPKLNTSSLSSNEKIRSLIIVFTNGYQEKVDLFKSETVRQLLERLLKNRNLNFTSFEAYPMGSEKELDLNSDVIDLKCDRIRVEQRVKFEVKLPNGLTVSVKSKPSIMCAKVLNPILTEFNHKYDPEYYEIRFADTWKRLTPDLPIFCADNRKLIVLYKGINECKSIISEPVVETNCQSVYQKERQKLNEFLGKESHFYRSSYQKNKNFLNISDVSFNDDLKTEEFFNDLMKCSQTVPKETKELKLTPKLNFSNKSKKIDKNGNILENILFLSEKLSDQKSNSNKSQSKSSMNTSNLFDFKRKSPPTLKSDQLYDKRHVRRVDKVIESKDKYPVNKNCGQNSRENSTENMKSISIKTLSKFHKTSNEKLLTQTRNEIQRKIEVPDYFDLK